MAELTYEVTIYWGDDDVPSPTANDLEEALAAGLDETMAVPDGTSIMAGGPNG